MDPVLTPEYVDGGTPPPLAILDRIARATGWKTPAASRFSSSTCKSGSYLGEDVIGRFDDVYGRRNS